MIRLEITAIINFSDIAVNESISIDEGKLIDGVDVSTLIATDVIQNYTGTVTVTNI